MKLPFWTYGAAGAVVVVIAGALIWNAHRAKSVDYVTAPVDRGTITRTITASGSVNPEITVQVGAFVSGTINALSCDYNTIVRKGQVCATIDPRPYELTADQDRAALGIAKAQLAKDRASLVYAELTSRRDERLVAQDSVSRDAADDARNQRDQARSQVALDQATIVQRKAALEAAEVNLGYTRIVSPVDGVVVSRNVTVGQTVASSFQTPTLFLIAKDLTRMQVDTNVSESDIGGARMGAPATFGVEAWPGRTFSGRVTQVRQAPISVQNVITYDAVIAADNPGLLLKPGMTATAQIVVDQRRNVLRAPAQALHYTPPAQEAAPAPGAAGRRKAQGQQQVWVLRDGRAQRVPVATGLDDDAHVEIVSGDLQAGDRVIVSGGQAGRAAPAQGSSSAPTRLGP
jgi:HlyD family secretion protein